MDTVISEIFQLKEESEKICLKYFSDNIKAGVTSFATGHVEKEIDIAEYLVRKPASTFVVTVQGDSMEPEIHPGDKLVVDSSIKEVLNKIVIGSIDGEFTVKRLVKDKNKLYLVAENKEYAPIEITGNMNFQVFGVVTFILHAV